MKFIFKGLKEVVPEENIPQESFHQGFHAIPEGVDVGSPNNPILNQSNQYHAELKNNLGIQGDFKTTLDKLSPDNVYGKSDENGNSIDVDENSLYPHKVTNVNIDTPENTDVTNLLAPIFNRNYVDTHHKKNDSAFTQESKAFVPIVRDIVSSDGKINEDNLKKWYKDDKNYDDFRKRNEKILTEGVTPEIGKKLLEDERFLRQHLRSNPNDKPKDIDEIQKNFKSLHFGENEEKVFQKVNELIPGIADKTINVYGDEHKLGDEELGNFTYHSAIKNPVHLLKLALLGYNAGNWYAEWQKKLGLHGNEIVDNMGEESKQYLNRILPRFFGALGQATGVEQNYQAFHKMVSRLLHNQVIPNFIVDTHDEEGNVKKEINPDILNGKMDITHIKNSILNMSKKGLSASLSANGFSEDNLAAAIMDKDFKTPKIMDYVSGFLGRRGGAMDMWMLRMMFGVRMKNGKKVDEEVPEKREYDYMLGMVHHLTDVIGTLTGKKYGTNAVQAMLWVGYKKYIAKQRTTVIDTIENELKEKGLLNETIMTKDGKKSTLSAELNKMRSITNKITAGGTVDETLSEKGIDSNNPRIENLSSHHIQEKYSPMLNELTNENNGEDGNPLIKTKYKDVYGVSGSDEKKQNNFLDYVESKINDGSAPDLKVYREKTNSGKDVNFIHGNHADIKALLGDFHSELGTPRIKEKHGDINDNDFWHFNNKDSLKKIAGTKTGRKKQVEETPLVFTNELKGGILPQKSDNVNEQEKLGNSHPIVGGAYHVDIHPKGIEKIYQDFNTNPEFFNDMIRVGKNIFANEDTKYREFNPETGDFTSNSKQEQENNLNYKHPYKSKIETSDIDAPPVMKRIAFLALKLAELRGMDIGEVKPFPLTYKHPDELKEGYTDSEHPLNTKKGMELTNEQKSRFRERIKKSYSEYLEQTQLGTSFKKKPNDSRSNNARTTFAFFGIRSSITK